jgi:hypothetical protein
MALSGQINCAKVCPLLDQSKQTRILPEDSLSANDPFIHSYLTSHLTPKSWRLDFSFIGDKPACFQSQ